MQIVDAIRVLTNRIKSRVVDSFIIIENATLQYDSERTLDDLDLVYKTYLENRLPLPRDFKSRLTISGSHSIDWYTEFATNQAGDATTSTWYEVYGVWGDFTCWYELSAGVWQQITLPITRNGDDFIIDATGLVDVIVIIS